MSTYFEFECGVCHQQGGFFSRQAWGWGNADVIANHKFIVHHLRTCGHGTELTLRVHNEHSRDYAERHDRSYLAETKDVMPHSEDWSFVADLPNEVNWRDAWHDKFADDDSIG